MSNQFSRPMAPSVANAMAKVPGVRDVSRVRHGDGLFDDAPASVEAVDAATYRSVAPVTLTSGSDALTDGGVLVSSQKASDYGVHVGQQVRMSLDRSHVSTLRVVGVYDKSKSGLGDDYVVTLPTFEKMGGSTKDGTLYVLEERSASTASVKKALEATVADIPTISVKDQAGYAAEQREPIERMLVLIYALLGLAIVIAVLGIINTLALSVIERTREIGLLRAVGLARGQLRSMIRLEAVTISLVGAVIGVVLGTIFGVLFQRTQAGSGVDVLVIPVLRLLLFLALAALVGVLAAWWPARRAARSNILAAIAAE